MGMNFMKGHRGQNDFYFVVMDKDEDEDDKYFCCAVPLQFENETTLHYRAADHVYCDVNQAYNNIRKWKGLEFHKSQKAVENREKWRKLVAKSSMVPH